jgi:cytochrome c oxidase assembly protein subunit 15
MTGMQARLSLVRRLAIACAVLVLAVTSLSAFVRLSRAGFGCEPWPQCYVQRATLPSEALAASDGQAVLAARWAHRVAATATLLLVIALLMKTLALQPPLQRQGRLVLALLAVSLFLAVLGRMGGDSRGPVVILGNLVGGLVMFAVACRLVLASKRDAAAKTVLARRLHPWFLAGLALVLLQVVLGGLLHAQHVANQCDLWAPCSAHHAAGWLVSAALLSLGLVAWRAGLALGGVLGALAVLQAALGIAQPAAAGSLVLALAHNVAAALLLGTLAGLLAVTRSDEAPGP